MTAAALRRIEADLNEIVARATAEHPIDPHEIHIAAVRIAAQAEMIEGRITEEGAA